MKYENIILLLLVVILMIAPMVMYLGQGEDDGKFGGTDDQGGEQIAESYNVVDDDGNLVEDLYDEGAEKDPNKQDYKFWFASPWEPPSGEIESLLFALQAAIGAIIIGYFFGYWRGQGKEED